MNQVSNCIMWVGQFEIPTRRHLEYMSNLLEHYTKIIFVITPNREEEDNLSLLEREVLLHSMLCKAKINKSKYEILYQMGCTNEKRWTTDILFQCQKWEVKTLLFEFDELKQRFNDGQTQIPMLSYQTELTLLESNAVKEALKQKGYWLLKRFLTDTVYDLLLPKLLYPSPMKVLYGKKVVFVLLLQEKDAEQQFVLIGREDRTGHVEKEKYCLPSKEITKSQSPFDTAIALLNEMTGRTNILTSKTCFSPIVRTEGGIYPLSYFDLEQDDLTDCYYFVMKIEGDSTTFLKQDREEAGLTAIHFHPIDAKLKEAIQQKQYDVITQALYAQKSYLQERANC